MSQKTIEVKIDVLEHEKLIKALYKQGINMPIQCNEGFCGTCVCKSNPKQFEEVHDQIGLLNPDENVLPCSVRAKAGVKSVIVELPAHLVPSHIKKIEDNTSVELGM